MPTQNSNRHTTWTIDQDNETWTLAKNAKISIDNNGHGIYESGHDGSTIKVLGDIKVTGMAYGISISGSNSEILVGKDSKVDASGAVSGINTEAAGAHIENRGLVDGAMYGIQGQIWSNVENYGTIRGKDGISHDGAGSQIYNYGKVDASEYGVVEMAGGNHIENAKGALISGDEKAIFLYDSGTADIVNKGTLRGDIAIDTYGGVQTVKNSGQIIGDVMLGEDADVFDTRKGSVKGEVHGGDGNDDYYVGKAKIKIVEDSSGGSDDVNSTATHKLAAEVENLYLLGKKDIDGTGNGGMNVLYGNAGDNHLNGMGGTDYLSGGLGNDMLKGGAGQDYFIFDRAGVDHITDFEDGSDQLVIDGVNNQSDFDALNIKQIDGDTVINFGDGNKIVIDGLLKSDFTFSEDVSLL